MLLPREDFNRRTLPSHGVPCGHSRAAAPRQYPVGAWAAERGPPRRVWPSFLRAYGPEESVRVAGAAEECVGRSAMTLRGISARPSCRMLFVSATRTQFTPGLIEAWKKLDREGRGGASSGAGGAPAQGAEAFSARWAGDGGHELEGAPRPGGTRFFHTGSAGVGDSQRQGA